MPRTIVGRLVQIKPPDPRSALGNHTFPIGARGVILCVEENGVYRIQAGPDRAIQDLALSEFAFLPDDSVIELSPEVGRIVRVIRVDQNSLYGRHYIPIGAYGRIESLSNSGGFRVLSPQLGNSQTLVRSEFVVTTETDIPETEGETMPNIIECLNCGESVREDDTCASCSACQGCCDCESEHADGIIADAHCRSYPEMRPFPAPTPHFLYLGVELEVELPDGDRSEVARRLKKDYCADILIKHDASLDDGFEMVSGPFSLEEHKLLWPNLLPAASKFGARSWSYSTTGLHVHLSRAFFTPLVLGKLLVFLNSEATREHIVLLAGRKCPDFAAMEKKKLTDVMSKTRRYCYRNEVYTYEIDRRCRGTSTSRYEALNLQNEKTVEIRIFKGTLHVEHVLADIEFCHAVAHWVTDCSIQECENWSSFWAYVLAHKKEYTELVQYMSSEKHNKE